MTYYGSEVNPAELSVALNWTRIGPGDTIYLRGGTYTGDFVCDIDGTAALPIHIKPYPGEFPIIDGSLIVTGNHVHFYDMEIRYSGWTNRESAPEEDIKIIDLRGANNRLIGCVIHDTFNNGSWETNTSGGLYECLIYNCGCHRAASDDDEGHAIYTQNEFATQSHHNNICWGQYNFGLHGYTAGGLLDYFDWRYNICFRNTGRQFALGGLGGQRAHNCTLDSNVMLEGDGWLKGNDIALTNNYSPNGFTIDAASVNVTQSGNTFTAPGSGTNIFVFPRTYKAGWAHVSIFNWDSADNVNLDLSSVTGLNEGDTYNLHNAQDYFTDIATGTVPANKIISVDMRAVSHSVVARIGSTAVATTFPTFGAFVVEKV
jgi:hypothetical protein